MNIFNSPVGTIQDKDVSYLNAVLLDEKGQLMPVAAEVLPQFPYDDLRLWCNKNAVYGLITNELIDWLKETIGERKAIEIGAGNGCLGRSLGIPITDSRVQETEEVIQYYKAIGQPVVKYGADVEKLEALEAVRKYRPDAVIGCWITQWTHPDKVPTGGGSIYGVKESLLLDKVKTYILIGNATVHGSKNIMKWKPTMHQAPWLWSRSARPDQNAIWVWNKCH